MIGVRDVAGLAYLQGVESGLDGFQEWAAGQGFEVVRHDDFTGPLSGDVVYESVKDVVTSGDVCRLFVFFSGHGLATGIGDDLWLLSDAAENPAAAVNVAKSVELARFAGIPHVAIFADACRTPPDAAMLGVTGRPIFPQCGIVAPVQIDQFFATVSGDPAYENEKVGGEAAFGIFTRCLLSGLRGEEPSVLTPVVGQPTPHAVTSISLARWLWTEVRELSSARFNVTQSPSCIAGSFWEPNVLSWVAPPPSVNGGREAEVAHAGGEISFDAGTDDSRAGSAAASPRAAHNPLEDLLYLQRATRSAPTAAAGGSSVAERSRRRAVEKELDRHELLSRLSERILARPGREHFESGIGASVVGARLVTALVAGGDDGVFEADGGWHVRGRQGEAATALLEIELPGTGRAWVATALHPGYVTTVSVGTRGADHVAFVASQSDHIERDRQVLAAAGASARAGRFSFADEPEVVDLVATGNPSASLLSAYAFHRSGRFSDVDSIRDRFHSVGAPLPYDLAILAAVPLQRLRECVPAFPLMARGWALCDSLPAGKRLYSYARRKLTGSVWTTFGSLTPHALVTLLPEKERTQ